MRYLSLFSIAAFVLHSTTGFSAHQRTFTVSHMKAGAVVDNAITGRSKVSLKATPETKEEGVIELSDAPPKLEGEKQVAPFLSQGEVDPDALNPDLSDAKEARVILYMIISLLPVLFLIPLMLGSREMIPADWLPPVEIN